MVYYSQWSSRELRDDDTELCQENDEIELFQDDEEINEEQE